ncbi:hypothetical protein ACF0H5_012828 [Mactra antiquata]
MANRGPNKPCVKGEKENDKLLTNAEGYKGTQYGNLKVSGDGGSFTSSPGTKSLIDKITKEDQLKSPPEDETPKGSCKRKILKAVVTTLFIVIVVGIIIIWTLHEGRSKKHIGNEYFDFISKLRVLNVYNEKDNVVLVGWLKSEDFDYGRVRKCDPDQTEDTFCFRFADQSVFQLYLYTIPGSDVQCADIMWHNLTRDTLISKDCYEVAYGFWYGMPNFKGQFWPLDTREVVIDHMTYQPYQENILGPVLENFWISSSGTSIILHQNLPIKFSFNTKKKKQFCFGPDFDNIPDHSVQTYNYTICQGPDVKSTFLAARNKFFPKTRVIDYEQHDFSKIIWKFGNDHKSNPDNFGDFLHQLHTAGLPMNMVEYDAVWQGQLGDFKFNPLTLNQISLYLKGKYINTKLMLPLSLACSYLSKNFYRGAGDRLFVKDKHTYGFKTVLYKDQSCALWDASNPATREFIKSQLESLQQKGTIEETEFPQAFDFKTRPSNNVVHRLLYKNSSDINAMNSDFVSLLRSVNKSVVLETAHHMQNLTVFVEIPTVVANKSGKKCLDFMLQGVLTAGLHGYPYTVSLAPSEDMIDEELFMRWIQVAMFLPGLRVTNAAVSFGDKISKLVQNMSNYRNTVIIPMFSKIVSNITDGFPLVRPLWWINPKDANTWTVSDQFLIGDTLMVAPVLCHGDRSRKIYFPVGDWVHTLTDTHYTGKKWVEDFPVKLDEIPVFELSTEEPED